MRVVFHIILLQALSITQVLKGTVEDFSLNQLRRTAYGLYEGACFSRADQGLSWC